MFNDEELPQLRESVRECARGDQRLLQELRTEAVSLKHSVRPIHSRTTTAVSLVASDGGNNSLQFDPFFVHLVRVVDSYGKQLCLDAISPSTDTDRLSERQFESNGTPRTALGRLMSALDIRSRLLSDLSTMIPKGELVRKHPDKVSPSWVMVYRDLVEWAVLFDTIMEGKFGTDTLLVRDGLLRSKIFVRDLFVKMCNMVTDRIGEIARKDKRTIFLVGLAKHSKVLQRYQLAMALEDVFPGGSPRFVRIPRELEAKAYVWPEWARGEETGEGGELPKFVAGVLYLVRFGSLKNDPVWSVDILNSQIEQDQEIFGYLLADAINGFPIPYYPRCLQRAHEYATISGFDQDILQDEVYNAVRDILPESNKYIVDTIRLQTDVGKRRYE